MRIIGRLKRIIDTLEIIIGRKKIQHRIIGKNFSILHSWPGLLYIGGVVPVTAAELALFLGFACDGWGHVISRLRLE